MYPNDLMTIVPEKGKGKKKKKNKKPDKSGVKEKE